VGKVEWVGTTYIYTLRWVPFLVNHFVEILEIVELFFGGVKVVRDSLWFPLVGLQ